MAAARTGGAGSTSAGKSKKTNQAGSRGTSRTAGNKKTKAPDPRRSEKWLFILLAFNIYLLLSNFFNTGFLGRYMAMFLFGLFGTVAYILPVYFFLTEAFFVSVCCRSTCRSRQEQ